MIPDLQNKFSLSSSGAVGIICPYGALSLSVIYRGSSQLLQESLTYRSYYYSAVFMKNSGKLHLAATCKNDNTLHLWNLENNTSSIVYKEKSDKGKEMNLCVIDDRTVAYGAVNPSREDKSNKIYILMMNTQPWTLSSMLLVHAAGEKTKVHS